MKYTNSGLPGDNAEESKPRSRRRAGGKIKRVRTERTKFDKQRMLSGKTAFDKELVDMGDDDFEGIDDFDDEELAVLDDLDEDFGEDEYGEQDYGDQDFAESDE